VGDGLRILAGFALQALGAFYGIGTVLLLIERYTENGAILSRVLFVFLEAICLAMVVGGARLRGKRQSGGFPLDS
jgi:ABC-type siderophore export system fused ATPase/permease subunit